MGIREVTAILLDKRNKIDREIEILQEDRHDLTVDICKEEGTCPDCNNWHYPHCRNGST
jgi:hypothetical protein